MNPLRRRKMNWVLDDPARPRGAGRRALVAGQARRASQNASGVLMTEEEVLSVLDVEHAGWKGDREGWVTVERGAIAWRVHYRRGELLEIGWWGTARAPGLTPGV